MVFSHSRVESRFPPDSFCLPCYTTSSILLLGPALRPLSLWREGLCLPACTCGMICWSSSGREFIHSDRHFWMCSAEDRTCGILSGTKGADVTLLRPDSLFVTVAILSSTVSETNVLPAVWCNMEPLLWSSMTGGNPNARPIKLVWQCSAQSAHIKQIHWIQRKKDFTHSEKRKGENTVQISGRVTSPTICFDRLVGHNKGGRCIWKSV